MTPSPNPATTDPDHPVRPLTDADNNFNLLRLGLALMVAFYHIAYVPGAAALASAVGPLSLGAELGVQGFFVLSGYLVFGSLERTSSLGRFAEKRLRRLYPAYAVVIVACAVAALGVSPVARARLNDVAGYLGWNLTFLNFFHPDLPGLFASNPITAVNGALWTLKIEVSFYLALPVFAWLLLRAGQLRWLLLAAIYVGAEAWRLGFTAFAHASVRPILVEVARQLPGQMSFFITGVALYRWREAIAGARGPLWAAAGLFLTVLSLAAPWAIPVRALGLGLALVWLGVGLPRVLDLSPIGDLSYGVYIVHFPIVQALVAAGLFSVSPWLAAFAALIVSLLASAALWRWVERPALRGDSIYRRGRGRSRDANAVASPLK